MTEPEFDKDGYPTEETLKTVREWDYKDVPSFFAFCQKAWYFEEGVTRTGSYYLFSTLGWSGNEEIIGAMESNMMIWVMTWISSERGGHYKFRLPEAKRGA